MKRDTKLISTICIVVSLFSASVLCEGELDLNDLKSKLPAGIELPSSLQNITLPTLDEVKAVVKSKCDQVSGGDAAYKTVEAASEELKICASDLIDFSELQTEIEKAQPNGELDTVFNKYCRRRTVAIECLKNFTATVEPCLEPKEIEGEKTLVKIVTNVLNFVCHKDGDQIALFIAEKGPECFDAKKDDIIACVNGTFSKYHTPENEKKLKDITANTELPQFVVGMEQCHDMNKLQNCIVSTLEDCEESTPANLVESMFKFIRNETPCINVTVPEREPKTKSGAGQLSVLSTGFMGLALLLLIREY